MPLSSNDVFRPFCYELSQKLRKVGVSNRIDDSSATIGKRYSRNDELGTPLGITIDFQTVQDKTVTLRDRDSTKQVRADEDTIIAAILSVVDGSKTWQDVNPSCQLSLDRRLRLLSGKYVYFETRWRCLAWPNSRVASPSPHAIYSTSRKDKCPLLAIFMVLHVRTPRQVPCLPDDLSPVDSRAIPQRHDRFYFCFSQCQCTVLKQISGIVLEGKN